MLENIIVGGIVLLCIILIGRRTIDGRRPLPAVSGGEQRQARGCWERVKEDLLGELASPKRLRIFQDPSGFDLRGLAKTGGIA